MAKIRANAHYNPSVADPLDPITFVNKIKVPVFMACQWEDEQTGGHCPDLAAALHRHDAEVVHVHQRRPHRLARPRTPSTAGTTSSSCSSPTRRRSSTRRSIRAAAPVIYQSAMGLPDNDADHAAARPDPDRADLRRRAGGVRGAARGAGAVRQRRRARRRPAAARRATRTPASSSRSRRFPIPGTVAQQLVPRPERHARRQPPRHEPAIDSYTSNAKALPLTDFGIGNTGGGGLWGNASQWQWNWKQNPAGTAVSYVSAPLTHQHDGDRRRRGAPLGPARRRPTSTCRPRSARSTRTATRRSCRTAGCAPASASSRPGRTTSSSSRARCSSRSRACSPRTSAPMPKGKFVEVVIPLYYEGHAYRAGSRIRVTIAAPNGTQPIWSFSQTEPATGTADGVDRVLAARCRRAWSCRSSPASRVPTGAAGLPEPAQRAVPGLHGLRQPLSHPGSVIALATVSRCASRPGMSTRSSSACRGCCPGSTSARPTSSACRRPSSPTTPSSSCSATSSPTAATQAALHGEAAWNGVAILSRVGLDDVVAGHPRRARASRTPRRARCRRPAAGSGWSRCTCPTAASPTPSTTATSSPGWPRCARWSRAEPRATVVCGDMNIAPTDADVFDPEAYVGQTHVTAPERAALAELQALGLHDVVRERWPDRARLHLLGLPRRDVPPGPRDAHRPDPGRRAGGRARAGGLGRPPGPQGQGTERPRAGDRRPRRGPRRRHRPGRAAAVGARPPRRGAVKLPQAR